MVFAVGKYRIMATYFQGGLTFTTTPANRITVSGPGISGPGIDVGGLDEFTGRNLVAAATSTKATNEARSTLLSLAPSAATIQSGLATQASNPPDPQVTQPSAPVTVAQASAQAPVPGFFAVQDENGNWGVVDQFNEPPAGRASTNLTQEQAETLANQLNFTDTGGVPTDTLAGTQTDPGEIPGVTTQSLAEIQAAQAELTKRQGALQAQRKYTNKGDWRFRISLAPRSDYLYNDPDNPGILAPLKPTNGVIFPYTPSVTMNYNAAYEAYNLTHSNYRGQWYQSSYVGDIQVLGTFTAQDTSEAQYLLAVIHFFRSVTKMFYGARDSYAGTPPPLVYVTGLGEYQYAQHPCVVSQFNYTTPTDVDYIRARSINVSSTNLSPRRDRAYDPGNSFDAARQRLSQARQRLAEAKIKKGAVNTPPAPPTLGIADSTYVPTKIDISLVLLPIQSREQISKGFNVKEFASGQLLAGGYW